jgi:hypothetical protein
VPIKVIGNKLDQNAEDTYGQKGIVCQPARMSSLPAISHDCCMVLQPYHVPIPNLFMQQSHPTEPLVSKQDGSNNAFGTVSERLVTKLI